MASLGFNLPDVPNGKVIDWLVAVGVTAFVLAADLNAEVRNLF